MFVIFYPLSLQNKPDYPTFSGAAFDGAQCFHKYKVLAVFYIGKKPSWADARKFGYVYNIKDVAADHWVNLPKDLNA